MMPYRNQASEGHGPRLSMSAHQIKPKCTSAYQPGAWTTAQPRVDDAVLRDQIMCLIMSAADQAQVGITEAVLQESKALH